MSDIVERLRAPANWLRQDKGEGWKDAINRYDRTPYEAADEIERLAAEAVRLREALAICRIYVDSQVRRGAWGYLRKQARDDLAKIDALSQKESTP